MSWLYSQALVEEYWEGNSLDGEQSAPLNGKPIQQAYCAPDKMTAFSRLSRFGMTYKPLMEHHGEALLKSYLAAFHVPTSASQDAAQDLMESNPPCGITWRGWLAKFDPDAYLWKTAQCSFIEDSDESLATFPVSGMTRGGLLWERQMSEHRINATASGLWRTPDTGGGTSGLLKQGKNHRENGQPIQIRLVDQVNNPRLWPTITINGNYNRKGLSKTSGDGLATVVGGPLNPPWVEWLMGWPQGWTDLKPLEMDKCLYARQPHGESLQKDN